jgi:hypothetical protein
MKSDPVVEMKAGLDAARVEVDRLLDEKDYPAADAASDRAGEIYAKMRLVVPTTAEGLIAQLEILRGTDDEPGNLDVLIAGVRACLVVEI